ncbi:MAG: hypothetical protein Kow0010_09010 [Dehalococcoidia bacterium]
MGSADDHLRHWLEAGLIDEATAGRIREFERGARPEREAPIPIPRPSLVEALLYVGVIVVAVGVFSLLERNWGELETWARIAVLAVPAAMALVAGWAMQATGDAPFVRGGDMTWLAGTALAGGTAAVVMHESDVEGQTVFLLAALSASLIALALWAVSPSYPQVLGVGGSLVVLGFSIANWPDDFRTVLGGPFMLAFGAAGIALTELRMAHPRLGAAVVFAALAAFGAFFTGLEDEVLWAELMSFVIAAGLMALSIWRQSFTYLLFGVALAFLQLVTFMFEYFEDTIGAPVALIISGGALIAAVLLLIPMRQALGGRSSVA